MRQNDMPDKINESEAAHAVGRRTADELTAHLLTTLSENVKALTTQIEEVKVMFHRMEIAMTRQQGHNDGQIEVLDQKVKSLEGWRTDVTKQLVAIVVLILVALFLAIAKGAGIVLK